jgi:hypothetical protein
MILIVNPDTLGKPKGAPEDRDSVRGSEDWTLQQDGEDVRRCMRVLGWAEGHYHLAGRLQ